MKFIERRKRLESCWDQSNICGRSIFRSVFCVKKEITKQRKPKISYKMIQNKNWISFTKWILHLQLRCLSIQRKEERNCILEISIFLPLINCQIPSGGNKMWGEGLKRRWKRSLGLEYSRSWCWRLIMTLRLHLRTCGDRLPLKWWLLFTKILLETKKLNKQVISCCHVFSLRKTWKRSTIKGSVQVIVALFPSQLSVHICLTTSVCL